MKKPTTPSTGLASRLWIGALILLGLLIVSSLAAVMFSDTAETAGANTAIIRITGPIVGDSDGGLFAAGSASSTEIVRQLEQARDDDSITGVILEINSPGGSAVASDEIAQAVKDVRAQNKTVVAWIREVGASGGYWIASSSDHIVANRMSITGSIGVISSYLEFDEFIDEWNVSYNRLVAGDRKDIGDPFQNLTPENREFLQHKLNRVHAYFIDEVAHNRNMSTEKVRQLADGSFYLGVEAYEVGLVDELGGKQEAIAYLERTHGTSVETTEYGPEKSFLEQMLGVFSSQRKVDVRDFVQQPSTQTPYIPMLR